MPGIKMLQNFIFKSWTQKNPIVEKFVFLRMDEYTTSPVSYVIYQYEFPQPSAMPNLDNADLYKKYCEGKDSFSDGNIFLESLASETGIREEKLIFV